MGKTYETVVYLKEYMKTVCDDVISNVIGQDYETEFPNILYNKGKVTQQKYHHDYKYY